MNLIQVALNKVLPQEINFKKYAIISVVLILVGASMSFLVVPTIVTTIVKYMTVLKQGRFIRQKHVDKLPFTYKVYLWNVTNPDQISAGTEKPKMQEIGPYVFSQFKQKIDTVDNAADDTFTFDLWNIYNFNPELSAPLTGEEIVYLVDVVLVAIATKVKLESPHQMNLVAEGLDTIFKKPSSIFVRMTAMEFIDKGVEVNCNQTIYAATALCAQMRRTQTLKILNDEKTLLRYRWFDKLNNSIQARYTVYRGNKNIHDVGRVVTVNEKPTLKVFQEDRKCNVINGTDKQFYPPFQKKTDVVWVFSDDACKSFPLRYSHMKSVRGAKTAWKALRLDDELMNPYCECDKYIGCTPRGTLDMYPCLDIFVLGSLPHFYLTDPSILTTLDGLNPQEDLHKTGIYFDLLTGGPILSFERFQISWLVKQIPEYPIFSKISGDVWIPVMWYDESFSMEKSDVVLIILSRVSRIVGIATGYMLMSLGIVGLIVLALRFHYKTSVVPAVVVMETLN